VNWLKENAWLANWLAVIVAIAIAAFQGFRSARGEKIDWARVVIYFTFLSSLAVAFTPLFDGTARTVSYTLVMLSFVYIFLEGMKNLVNRP
jgi:hypothetical protein